jgi:transposase
MENAMSKKALVPNRQYTDEFKAEAVRLGLSIGGNAAAQRLGIAQSTMTNWVRLSKAGTVSGEPPATPARRPVSELEAENARLRRELASTKLDLEIVKKAAAYFAKESR